MAPRTGFGALARAVWVSAALVAVGGCAFTGVRREPSPPPSFRYANPRLQSVLHDIPVVIDYVDCVDTAMVNKRSIFGSVSFAGTFPLRNIALREFGRFVNENMRTPLDGEAEKVVLKIYSKRILVEQKWSRSHAEMVFDVQLLDAKSEDARPYFRGSFRGEWDATCKDDRMVPETVYRCFGKIVRDFASTLAADGTAMRRLSLVALPADRLSPPSLKHISFSEVRNGVVAGKCIVDCNGWDGFNTDKWARGQINSSCSMKLGVEPERLRVVYSSDIYEQKTKRWGYAFKAFARAPIVMDYDSTTRSGVVIGDLVLMNVPVEEAMKRMRNFVIGEMRSHGGAVKSTAGDESVRVRFHGVKTDTTTNLLQIDFNLPY